MVYDSDTLFECACENYEKIKGTLLSLTNVYNSLGKEKASYDGVLADFDIVLEAFLAMTSLVNGRFDPIERDFIETLTDHADLTEHIRRGGYNVTWEHIMNVRIEDIPRFVEGLAQYVANTVMPPLVHVLGAADAHVEEDVLSMVREYVMKIVFMLAGIDGDDSESETFNCEYAAMDKVVDLFFDLWEQERDVECLAIEEYYMR